MHALGPLPAKDVVKGRPQAFGRDDQSEGCKQRKEGEIAVGEDQHGISHPCRRLQLPVCLRHRLCTQQARCREIQQCQDQQHGQCLQAKACLYERLQMLGHDGYERLPVR